LWYGTAHQEGGIVINCVDIGGSFLKFGVAWSSGEVKGLEHVATPTQDFERFAQTLADQIARGPASNAPVALAIPGVIDPDTGLVTCANVNCLHGRPAARDLEAFLGRPVVVANDADCFALAEAGAGAGRGHRVVFAAILGTGVGGAIVVDGKLVVGAGGLTGEWGHGPVVADPKFACGCGQAGCVDTIGGARGLERLHLHLHDQRWTSRQIIDAWHAGDRQASQTCDLHVELVSGPLALVVNVVGPSVVPVGGGLAQAPGLLARIDEAVRSKILRRLSTPLVVPAGCPGEPGLVGAGLLGLQTFFPNRVP